MPYKRPDLKDLVQEAEASIASRLPGADTRLRRSVLSVLARVLAGIAYGLYGYIHWISRQLFSDTADEFFLAMHGNIRKIFRKVAAQAEGPAEFDAKPGDILPAKTPIKRQDGQEYETTADVVADASGIIHAPIRGLEAGTDGNAVAGTELSLVSPVPGVPSISQSGRVAAPGILGGLNIENVESWRARIVYRWQNPERGGSTADWVRWARAVPGVANAYCQRHWMGLGTIGMIIVADWESGSPIPDAITVRRCQEYLEDPQRRPPGPSEVFVIPAVGKPVDLVIKGLVPDTEASRKAVRAELADLFLREAEPGKAMPRTHLTEAISVATGEYDHELTTPACNVVVRPYELPMLGSVEFTE